MACSSTRCLTAERLRNLLNYDRDSGEFTWRTNRSRGAKAGQPAGTVGRDGYRVIKIDGVVYGAHRLAWLYVHGEWPRLCIDHMNRQRADNRLCNLRDVTHGVNMHNATPCKNKLGVAGVSATAYGYRARIAENGVPRLLGSFRTMEEASAAYQAAKERLCGALA